ncbi:hypothetical protein L6164_029949 [Bauhinia variegata]|uniref:Uncharacterized protein n=1 Tax=Bauhinia variegata TaxID=167791 RepID=A0ACB9LAE8_BAUVA|nr:hypothetical protein L6164_029949 [Bauhinia variegata]
MLCFLCKTIFSQAHREIAPISISIQNQNLWFSVKCMSSTSNAQPFIVSYLINTCGFSPKKAASASKYLSFQTREKPDLKIEFFKKQGFSQTQVLRMIRGAPRLLLFDTEKNVLPKIQFLKSKGILCSELPKIISSCPDILRRSLEKQIIPSFDFFESLFQSEVNFMKALKRCPQILVLCNTRIVPNIKVFREEGVSELLIVKLLERQPRALTGSADRFKEIVAKVREMGFNPLTMKFMMAVAVLVCISKSTWTRKADLYKRLGWSDDDILAAFEKNPQFVTISEDKIAKTMNFFVNEMGWESSTLARYPVLLSLSLKKRIIPRASVIQVLLSKGLVKQLALQQIFYSSEKVFLDKFIMCQGNEADELLKLYQEKMDVDRKKL